MANKVARHLKEVPQTRYPGWTRLVWTAPDGHELNTQYRGPGGETISRREFRARVKAGELRSVAAVSGTFSAAKDLPSPAVQDLSFAEPEAAPPPLEAAPVMELPEAKSAGGRTAPGMASAAELALSTQILLIIGTSLLAIIARVPELLMTEQETQSIAVPVGNLLQPTELNRKFGRYLAGSSDYTLLGYALYAYAFRVAGQLAQRKAFEAQQPPQRGFPHAIAQSAGPAQPAAAPESGPAQAARGGIAAAASAQPAQGSRLVGFNPVPNPRAS